MRQIESAAAPLLASSALAQRFPLETNRHAFWRAFLAWQTDATDADLASLAQALEPHAQHVRPIHQAIGAALTDPSTVRLMPFELLLQLESAGWRVEHHGSIQMTLPLAA